MKLDKGREFFFFCRRRRRGSSLCRLPALPEEAPITDGSSGDQPKIAQRARRVLVVDDIADSAQSLAELLSLWGHQVRVAFDGEQALEIARTFVPELVLLDIGMPGMNGYEVARHLRQEFSRDQMKLVAMTGYGQDEDRRQVEAAGFNRHLLKPVDLPALCELLAQVSAGIGSVASMS